MQLSSLLKAKLRALPDKPGCYIFRDGSGRIIYVGKAASLRRRVQSYFRASTTRQAPPKLRSLVHSVAGLDFITVKTEADALLTENKLIKDYQPRFNILLRDDKRFPLLRIDPGRPWPHFCLCRFKRNDGALYFGPYISSAAARAALEFVETKFGLRKCAPPEPDAETHRHCLNDIIRFCSAPCIGKITPEEYASRVAEAVAFLRGERPLLLEELRADMDRAAAGLNFEKAAVLRDTLQMLYAALKQKAHIARTGGRCRQSPAAGLSALREMLGLRRRPMFIQAVDISNISGKHAVGSMVAAVAGRCRPALYRRFRIKTMEAVDDAAMMKEIIFRHFKRLKDEHKRMPDLLLIDGGIVQLQAAQSVLRELGVEEVAVAGLAKKFETIYIKEAQTVKTINLPPGSPALQVLQRLRDEAHRFAHAYHRRLRAKLIRESILDEIPALGPQRKQELLRHFGSVNALSRGAEDEIAAVPGISRMLARKIKEFLGYPTKAVVSGRT